MTFPLPVRQDLRHLLAMLGGKYVQLESLVERVGFTVPEVQYQDAQGALRLYTSLCANLSLQLARYMRLRHLVILPYLGDLQEKEQDGHDCESCGTRCGAQHSAHITDIREAHAELRELLEHLQPISLSLPLSPEPLQAMLGSLRTDMQQMEQILNEVLFIEESGLIPMMTDLQKNIGAHE